jgi:WD40 repeat protein/energy-coupling factor transporter ATP-binding protein EcfA2
MKKDSDNTLFNPFPGLRPFTIEESHLFFGREGQNEEILQKLSENNFCAVIGSSGSGKSSLIYCGLIPVLYGGFIAKAGSHWEIFTTRPGNSPITNLAHSLSRMDSGSDKEAETSTAIINSTLRSSSYGLVEAIRNLNKEQKNIFLLIDQFEELFRYKKTGNSQETFNESESFVKLLVEAVNQSEQPIYVVITMRSDFIGECSQFYELTEMINDSNYLVPQMTRDDFRKAIEGPIAVGGAEIEPQLVQQLLNEVGDNPDQLPILQHALMRTWDFWIENTNQDRPISISDYEGIGKMEKALSEHANEAFDELTGNEKTICEKLFKTITEKGNDNRGIRHPTRVAEIAAISKATPAEVINVIEPFRARGRSFLTPAADIPLDKDSIIDLSHESLMRIWNRLKLWVEEEYNAVQMYLRLCESAELYQKGKTGLWRPPDLQLAVNWKEKQEPTLEWAKRHNPAFERAMVYLKTSDEEYKAEEENKLKLQKRTLRRTRVFALVLGVAAVIALGLTLYSRTLQVKAQKQEEIAINERAEAEKQRENAEQQRKIAQEKEKEALEQKEEADNQRKIAENQRQLAERNAIEARKQTSLALQRQKEATEQRSIAEKNAQEAEQQRKQAEVARQEALRRRMLSIAQSMAVKSQQINDDPDLKALVAYQGYLFNEKYDGSSHNADIYDGMYYALKEFKGQSFNSLKGHTGSVRDVEFLPGTNTLYSTGGDGYIMKWDVRNPGETYSLIKENELVNRILALSEDGRWLACGNEDGEIQLFTTQDDSIYTTLRGHDKMVLSLDFTPDGKKLISSGNDKKILEWDMESFTSKTIFEYKEPINTIDLSPDGKVILGGSQDGKILVWNRASDDTVKTLYESKSAVKVVKYNNNGNYLAFGNQDGSLIIWDMNKNQKLHELTRHKARIYDIDFSPDDKLMATSSLDGTVQVWEFNQFNEQPYVLKDHESWVLSIAFSPDGESLITTSNLEERILVWPVYSNDIATELAGLINRNMTQGEWNTYVAEDIPYQETCEIPLKTTQNP